MAQQFIGVSFRDSRRLSKRWARNYLFRAWSGLTEFSSARMDTTTASMMPLTIVKDINRVACLDLATEEQARA